MDFKPSIRISIAIACLIPVVTLAPPSLARDGDSLNATMTSVTVVDYKTGLPGLPSTPPHKSPEILLSRPPLVSAPADSQRTRLVQNLNAAITDKNGRILYDVELTEDAAKRYPNVNPPKDKFPDWHKPRMRHLLKAMEKHYGFVAPSMTSWIANSFTAFLTPQQLKKIKKDQRVLDVSEVHRTVLSALWSDSQYYSEKISWGVDSMAAKWRYSTGARNVYVLDYGVGYHVELPNVVERVTTNTYYTGDPRVGCSPHATHVAGIISAPFNYQGVLGTNAGARIVSVTFGMKSSDANCATEGQIYDSLSNAIDLIYQKIQTSQRGVGIVNISMNAETGPEYKRDEALGRRILRLATPDPQVGYPGAFIAQSAGNFFQEACRYAYNGPGPADGAVPNDGIMVVGGIDQNGQAVTPLNGIGGFRNGSNAQSQAGSNYGVCVDVWAPANKIYSTWGGVNYPAQKQIDDPANPYSVYAYLSGTSMAAPHITGIAAHLAETQNLQTPAQIEQAVRAYMGRLGTGSGTLDYTGRPISVVNLAGYFPAAIPTTEFVVARSPTYGPGDIGSTLTVNSNEPFYLRYDSVGAQHCEYTRSKWMDNRWQPLEHNANAGTYMDSIKIDPLPPGSYSWGAKCVSSAGTSSYSEVFVNVSSPSPIVQATCPGSTRTTDIALDWINDRAKSFIGEVTTGVNYVFSLTTGAYGSKGMLSMGEYGGAMPVRTMIVSKERCDFDVYKPGQIGSIGTRHGLDFYVGSGPYNILEPNTKYYINIKSEDAINAPGTDTCSPGANCDFIFSFSH